MTKLPISLLGFSALASTIATPTGHTRNCVELQVPVTVTANNTRYNSFQVNSNIDVVDWIWDISTWSHANRTSDTIQVHGTYSINAQLCIPSQGKRSDILQIATHGFGFDKRYWDPTVKPEDYSYVDAALSKGYSILTYDRIGVGKSEKADAYDIIQGPLEVEILKELTTLVRNGKLVESSRINGKRPDNILRDYKPKKVVHVGHSYGSSSTAGLLQRYGKFSDGAILTGFLPGNQAGKVGPNAFGFEFARQHDPKRFGDRPSGYAVQSNLNSIQQIFFKKGKFEPELLEYAERTKETGTVGEFINLNLLQGEPGTDFKGPLQYFIGENDYAFCLGDCKDTYDVEVLKGINPTASDISVYLQPGTGHGITLHNNATAGYEVMFSYLASHGL
ncbi:alpha beta-hydrolase [Fusarium heterosporum]|uniref:Alpha beta-hydrolase n=1 Tax=Fusarium heterosporum TaxID=42747 RepID=A0A8H5WPK0_FUSHE|nr:alpha beta-hydrolase [Fusarium heterosporum]